MCISHFPSGAMNSYDFGDAVGGMGFREDVLHTLEPHTSLVAHPVALEQATTHTASCDLENHWRHRKRASSFPDMSHRTLYVLVTDGRTRRRLRLRRSATHPSAASTIRGKIPQRKTTKLLAINCLEVHDPLYDRSLRQHAAFPSADDDGHRSKPRHQTS